AAARALARSREAIAVTWQVSVAWMAGITLAVAMFATPSTPQRTVSIASPFLSDAGRIVHHGPTGGTWGTDDESRGHGPSAHPAGHGGGHGRRHRPHRRRRLVDRRPGSGRRPHRAVGATRLPARHRRSRGGPHLRRRVRVLRGRGCGDLRLRRRLPPRHVPRRR